MLYAPSPDEVEQSPKHVELSRMHTYMFLTYNVFVPFQWFFIGNNIGS